MRLRHVYLVLCVIGGLVPYSQFIPWCLQHGMDFSLFVHQLFANRISAFFGLDVIISSLVLLVFVFSEGQRIDLRHLWLPVLASFVVGVSLGLPLFLYMRQRHLDATTV